MNPVRRIVPAINPELRSFVYKSPLVLCNYRIALRCVTAKGTHAIVAVMGKQMLVILIFFPVYISVVYPTSNCRHAFHYNHLNPNKTTDKDTAGNMHNVSQMKIKLRSTRSTFCFLLPMLIKNGLPDTGGNPIGKRHVCVLDKSYQPSQVNP